ncbi:MAG: Lrp/AsnC family transcriptional regulator [Candidatus Micrarchaeota archaeon]
MKTEQGVRLDEVDKSILRFLSEDARASYREIAKKLKLSPSTPFFRVRKMRKEKVLLGFAPLINFEKLGWDFTIITLLKVHGGHLEEVEEAIAKIPNVYAVYDITGDWDALLVAKFRSRAELNKFVKSLLSMPHVERTCTHTVLNTVKEKLVGGPI